MCEIVLNNYVTTPSSSSLPSSLSFTVNEKASGCSTISQTWQAQSVEHLLYGATVIFPLCLSKGNSNMLANEFHSNCAWFYNYMVQTLHQLIKEFLKSNFTVIQTATNWSVYLKSVVWSVQGVDLHSLKWMSEYIQDHSHTHL